MASALLATKGGLGLSSVANQVKKLSESANGVNSTTLSNLKGLADAMKQLSSIGNLKISSSVANQITAINTALSSLNISDGANKINELVTALKPLETLGKSNLGSMVTSLKKLPETLQGLQSLDMGALKQKIQEVADAMKPLADEMQKVANGFNAFPNRIQKLIQENEKLSTSNNKASRSYINLYAKLRMAYQGIKTVAQTIGNCINLSNKYIEDMNLFNASMGEFASEAQEYAEKVGEIMGIDPGEWMRNQGVFMTLATGFGVVGERANIMSKNLTQLGYDLSSFFNISYEDAMLKLQSGLAGELEPLRRIGYDLSVARLQQEAYTLGINKKVSAMTQAEKAELRYYAIMTQVTTAQGDMARTLDAPANQLRILKSQVTQAGRAIGNIFIPLLNAVLPYLIAVTKIVRILANAIATLFGFTLPEVDYSNLSSGANSYSDALDNATDSAKKLQKYTMGFDELNIIDPNQGSGSGSDVSGGSGLGFDLPEYDFLGNATESRVGQIVDKMKEWLGITDDINTWSDLFGTRLGRILMLVGTIGAGFLAWKLTTGFISAITTLITLLATPSYAITLGLILTFTGFVIEYDGLVDAVKNGLNKFNFAEIIGGAILGVAGVTLLGKMIVTWIGKVCSTKVAFALARLGMSLGVETTEALGATLGMGIGGIIAGIPMFFVGIYDACKNGLDWLSGLLIPAGATLAGAGIGALIGAVGGPLGALIGLVVGLLVDLVIAIVQNWGTIAEWFDTNVITPVCDFFKGLWSTVSGYFSNLWDDISGVWNTVATWFEDNVIQPVSSLFSTVTDWIGTFFEGCWIIVQAVWIVASTWFDETVITPVSNFFKGLWETVSGFFTQLWEDVKLVWQTASTWFDENVTQPVKQLFETLWDDIKNVWPQRPTNKSF